MRLKMFTGIIEETGTVRNISLSGNSGRIQVGASVVLEGTKLGDSIAVNGVCLTVTSIDGRSFTADVMAETLRRSNLGQLGGGDLVNLERAMPAEGRFGGHIVSGHIDGTGTIAGMEKEGNATWVRIRTAAEILALIVEKGSIAIDGISLTVAQVGAEDFAVSIIPHTSANTTLLRKRIGDTVNLENDIVGKYVQRLVGQAQPQPQQQPHRSRITEEFLRENGF
jgi:riboflavin synthase